MEKTNEITINCTWSKIKSVDCQCGNSWIPIDFNDINCKQCERKAKEFTLKSKVNFNVRDKAWAMYNNKPMEFTIMSVTKRISNYADIHIVIKYVGRNETIKEDNSIDCFSTKSKFFESNELFKTKKDLIESLKVVDNA